VDEEIVRLLDRRAWLARRIGEIKHERGLAAYAPARERAVLNRVADLSEGDFPKRGLEAVFREIISCSISLEARLKVAYLGPEATFTHEAALRSFGTSVELEPQTTVAEVFARVERGEVEHGVVPVENSMEGAVTHTLDEMMDSPLKICGEVYLPVSQNLISAEPSLDRLEVVCSHPMALAQAAGWLRRELPGARLEEVESTAEAARRAAVEQGVAAIGSVLAAGTHGRQHTAGEGEHDALYCVGPHVGRENREGQDECALLGKGPSWRAQGRPLRLRGGGDQPYPNREPTEPQASLDVRVLRGLPRPSGGRQGDARAGCPGGALPVREPGRRIP
jgi:chorismate mutase